MPSTSEEGRTCWRMRASSVEERITGPMKPSDSRVEGIEPVDAPSSVFATPLSTTGARTRPAPPHVLRPIRNESRFGHAMPRRARRLTPRSASPHRRLAARARRLHVSPMRRLRSRRVARPTAPRRPPARLPDARASSAPIENSTTRRTASNPSIPPSSLATSSRSARRRSSTRNSRRPSAQSTTRSSSKNSAARRSSRPRRRLAKRWSARRERFVNATISWHSWKSSATTSAPSATSIASRAP